MPGIIPINHPKEILSYDNSGFENPIKFQSKNQLVKENGKSVSFKSKGWRYRIIDKKTRNFSFFEFRARQIAGVALVIFTCGFIFSSRYSKFVSDLIIKNHENRRFAVKESQINGQGLLEIPPIDKEELSKSERIIKSNLGDFQEAANWIHNHQNQILNRENIQGIVHYKLKGNNYIFELAIAPWFIFKMAGAEATKARYDSMVLAETVVRTHNLSLLVIPHAKHITQGNVSFIVEEKLNFRPFSSNQKILFHKEDDATLKEAFRQLAIFICKTGYNDVEWRNNPIFLDNHGNKKIGLIDIEHMKKPAMGLFGNDGWERTGLIGLIPVKHHEMIRNIARDHKIGYVDDDVYYQSTAKDITLGHSYIEATRIKDKMLREDILNPKREDKLAKWHHEHGIHVGNGKIPFDLSSNDFSIPEKDINHSLKCYNLAKEIITDFNNYFNSQIFPTLLSRELALKNAQKVENLDDTLNILHKKDVIFDFKTIVKDQHYHIQF